MILYKSRAKEQDMNINEVVEFLRAELKEVKFDEILNHLPLIENADVKHITGRQIDEDVIDIDIDTGDVQLHNTMNWTVTLRRIVNWYPIPNTYITINRDTVMADDVEVFPYGLSLVQSDVIETDEQFALKEPVCFEDIDYTELTESFECGYSLGELCESILDVINAEDKLKVLAVIKGFYDYDYDE